MDTIRIKGRPAYPGIASGEALVCPRSIQGWSGVSDVTGCIIEEGHPEKGKCIKDKILVMPYGKGSTGWSGHFHSAAVAGFCPAGWIFAEMDSRCGVATAVLEVPAVTDFLPETDVFSLIETGDFVTVNGDSGEVVIQKRKVKELANKKVYYNGYVYTVNAARDVATAVFIEEDRICFVGDDASAKAAGGPEAQLIDLEGHMMLPGFIDGHCHPILSAHVVQGVMLDIDSSTEENLADIRKFVEAHPEKDTYLGLGYAEWNFDEHGPKKELLDEICSDKPILIMSSSEHDAWVNSKTLELAGITKDTPDPVPGQRYFARDKDGNPSGHVAECATVNILFRKLNFFDNKLLKELLWQISTDYAANGVTTTADMGVIEMIGMENYRLGLEIMRDGGFLQRFNGPGLTVSEPAEVDDAIGYIHALKEEYDDDRMRIGLLKLLNDGTMESRTAANTEPYPGDGLVVEPLFTREELIDAVLKGAKDGFDINVHAIGSAAAKDVLAAAKAVREAGFDDIRITCSHSQYIDPEDVPFFAKYDVTANSTGVWFYGNPQMDDILGHINNETFRMRSLKDAGARIAFGSDFPADEYGNEPLKSIEMAVTRRMYDQPDAPMLKPYDEVLTVDDGIAGYTINNAYQLHMEDRLGSIEVGKYADMVVLEKNLFEIPPEEIHKVRVLETIIGGETVHKVEA